MPASGPRSRIGCILPARNGPWLNVAPALQCEFSGDNGDLKFPLRIPTLPGTHDMKLFGSKRCYAEKDELIMAYVVQAGQAATAGYFGGYTAKMQPAGKKAAFVRSGELKPASNEPREFSDVSRRLVRVLEGKGGNEDCAGDHEPRNAQ